MAQRHLSNEEFLTRLTTLLNTTHTSSHGSVFLTQKPLASTEDTAPPSQILIRATNGKSKPHRKLGEKQKLSTVVEIADLAPFYTRYAEVCKKGMEGLRKRDKKKAKKKKGKVGAIAGKAG